MKYMFASDIHGSAYFCKKMIDTYHKEGADRLVLLGDLLYHGPRNDLPKEYDPKQVIAMLNELKQELLVVRGNCDAEVDQMVLEFPILADYCLLEVDGDAIFATHGHLYHSDHLPPLKKDTIFIQGHTHVLRADKQDKYLLLNPGSVSLAKEGNPNTYGILENKTFSIKDFDGNTIKEITWNVLN